MNFPVTIELGVYSLPLHLICETLAFFVGYRYYLFLRKRSTDLISSENRIWIIIGAAAGALIGSRLLGAMERPLDWMEAANGWLYFYANKTVVGGFLGGWIGVELAKKIMGEPHSSGDLFTFPIILALMIGRVGCFSMGVFEQTYGVESSLPWALDLGDGVLRHPVALYEILFLLTLWVVLWKLWKTKNLPSGTIFKYFMVAYFSFRFLLDFIKPVFTYDHLHLSTIQIICLLAVFSSILLIENQKNNLITND